MDGLGTFSFRFNIFCRSLKAARITALMESGQRSVFALALSLVWSPLHLVPVMLAVVSVFIPLSYNPNLSSTT